MSDAPPPDDAPRRTRSRSGDLPASLIFSEMVRQAARTRPAEVEPAEPPPAPDAPIEMEMRLFHLPIAPTEPEPAPMAEEAAPEPVAEVVPVPPAPAPVVPAPSRSAPQPAPNPSDARLEAERVRRVKRRQNERQQRRVSVLGGVFRAVFVIGVASAIMGTILSWFTSPDFLDPDTRRELAAALYAVVPTPTPTPAPTPNWARTIGIVSGHRGPGQEADYDPGAVCLDAQGNVIVTENDINFGVASKVVQYLRARSYRVDLLDEFDPRLNDYQAAALVSIHSNSCQDYGEVVSGYLVAKAAAKPPNGPDDDLAECIARYYGPMTQLERRFSLTIDMTDYHNFREIHPLTPAAIIELGFMRADQQILVEQQDLLARAIVEGILCFLEPEDPFGFADPQATPAPTP
ncbi:MAG: N-acetylmuramoyl-L-alanine amidase [Anaerolineae bacterium]|jgi:N-acetylmuramoyl-L-alanine amidase|nr:N-acetylmuramoyl-L-alanine amidase [Anaerolineae bacterium]